MEIHSIRVWMGRRRPKREDAAACHIAHVLHFSYFRVDMLSSESCTATPKWRLLCVHINTRSLAKSGKERNNNINNDSSISFLLTSFFFFCGVGYPECGELDGGGIDCATRSMRHRDPKLLCTHHKIGPK